MFFARNKVYIDLLAEVPVMREEHDVMQLLHLLEDNGIRVAFNGYADLKYQGNDNMISKIHTLVNHFPLVKPFVVPYVYSNKTLSLDNLAEYANFLNLKFDIQAALTFILCNKDYLLRLDNKLHECEEGSISLVFRIDFDRPQSKGELDKSSEKKYKPAFGIVRVIYNTVYFHINQGEGMTNELFGEWNMLAFRESKI